MFVLQVDLKVKPGSAQALEKTYAETFRPAISPQQGFSFVDLLRPRDDGNAYVLNIVFEDQAAQQKWVATDVHQQVWPQMESHCASYAVRSYDTV